MKEITSIPNASRTFKALRNLGYDLYSSIADVVDNAITETVKAKHIAVYFDFDPDRNIVCRIQDDGCGMNENELEEAMRLGTDTTYEENDLGKFGMGMKTASLSHCDTLTVISKKKGSNICGYRWDINNIQKKGKWILLQLTKDEIDLILERENLDIANHGTIVFWDNLFLINENYKSYSNEKFAQNYYFRLLSRLKLHLGMIYHRFLDGTLGKEDSINLTVNDEPLEPWDPFCRSEPNTEIVELNKDLEELIIPKYSLPVHIKGYVVPNKESFSSEEAWKNAKGVLSWNDSQGYYIYRANRIIRYGGWHGTKAKDEHDKLARVSIDINASLDELFQITVNKTKVQFPEILYHHLKTKVNPKIVRKAKAKYNKSNDKLHVNNNFRKSKEKIDEVSKGLLEKNKIKTNVSENGQSNSVQVQNPSGTWLSNKINDFLKYGSERDYEIVSDHLEDGSLWKIVCNNEDKFKVIVNASHPFYSRIYKSSKNKSATGAIDALIFSLAFAELYNKNDQNAHLFDTFKTVCSRALQKLTEEEII
ncbi:ATP-binding protein [Mangrovivirga sp. M17]|uniref:ATP-binding protein n=1 Tax=Mangrovivirga halotolerans TaxID=2993936 RepID=A0ABT3RQX1_9BACT|nr:ATP-binding protein [Mangrovivirga halotolerans]MCX2743662.1 ATP-binding protein [Mangrovivirga halotolerans]